MFCSFVFNLILTGVYVLFFALMWSPVCSFLRFVVWVNLLIDLKLGLARYLLRKRYSTQLELGGHETERNAIFTTTWRFS